VVDRFEKANELEERLIDFAVRVVRVGGALSKNRAARHIVDQLIRCGTSPAANYGEARASESRADFIHKISIVAKELREAVVWLRILSRSGMVAGEKLAPLIDENQQLIRVFGATLNSLRTRMRKSK
jgi:four helix bundle protein